MQDGVDLHIQFLSLLYLHREARAASLILCAHSRCELLPHRSRSCPCILFFKQKTAYEIYQCDWSSGVCSSDLEIAKLTRMEYAFAFNLAYQGGQYGVAILSRLPIMATDHRRFKNLREAERRALNRAQ